MACVVPWLSMTQMIPMTTFMTSTTVRERDERVTRTVLTDPPPGRVYRHYTRGLVSRLVKLNVKR
jgi:hypothetical protein